MKPAPATTRSFGIAVAEFGASSVYWFKANDRTNQPPVVCEPAESTNGIRIDSSGNLWVPNGIANTTTEYAPHCGAAKLTIADPTGEPADVAFDRRGHVYIMNLNDRSGPPTVNVYTASGKPLRTLGDPSFHDTEGVASDTKGDVFVSNLTTGNVGTVVEFPQGKMPGKQLSGVSLGLPGVPAFDSHNNLVIGDWEQLTINVFAPPYASSPKTYPMMGPSIWCPLDRQERHIYCGDGGNGSIDVYAYPSGKYLYSDTADLSPSALVTGVAPDPPAPY
jgi:sugar lactone lactonase YvrE